MTTTTTRRRSGKVLLRCCCCCRRLWLELHHLSDGLGMVGCSKVEKFFFNGFPPLCWWTQYSGTCDDDGLCGKLYYVNDEHRWARWLVGAICPIDLMNYAKYQKCGIFFFWTPFHVCECESTFSIQCMYVCAVVICTFGISPSLFRATYQWFLLLGSVGS